MIPFEIINLDKPYKLRFGMRAMIEFERITGIKIMEILNNSDLLSSIDTIAKLIYVMIVKETEKDKELTVEKVIDLLDEHMESVNEITNIIGNVFKSAFPEIKNQKNVHPAAKK